MNRGVQLVSVAVVIPTFGRPDLLQSLVPQLLAQTLPPARILLVDDTPGDEVKAVAEALGVDYVRNRGRPSLTRSRNLGIETTTEPVIAFLDSDVQVPVDYLERMVALLGDAREPTAVQGFVPNNWNQQGWKRIPLRLLLQPVNAGTRMRFRYPFRNSFPHNPRGVSESEWLSGSNMVFHRERLGALRFDGAMERYCLGEDVEMGLQLRYHGHTLLLDADTVVQELNAEEGRLDNEDLALMRVVNVRHILRKYAPRRAKGVALTYQDVGWLLQKEPLRFFSNLRRYVRHRKLVRNMRSPDEWNPLYSFWESTSNK